MSRKADVERQRDYLIELARQFGESEMPRRVPSTKVNEKGTVLPHPHDLVRGRPVAGATTPAHEERILERHNTMPDRQPTRRKR